MADTNTTPELGNTLQTVDAGPPQPGVAPFALLQGGGSGCSCGSTAVPAGPPTYIYTLGRIRARFPSPAVEKEYAHARAMLPAGTPATDAKLLHDVLSQPQNRYLARRICWVLSVEGLETYVLVPRVAQDIDLLVDSLRDRPLPSVGNADIDLVVGVRGPMAPPELCGGLQLPIAIVDQIYSFDINTLIEAIPVPRDTPKDQFVAAANELFLYLVQLADNAGGTDEHRAINFLSVRYPAIYATAAEQQSRNASLSAVDVRASRLSGARKIVDVIFTYTNRTTGVTEQYFTRVDVTEQFPYLVTPLSRYFDR